MRRLWCDGVTPLASARRILAPGAALTAQRACFDPAHLRVSGRWHETSRPSTGPSCRDPQVLRRLAAPVEHDLSALPREHRRERVLVTLGGIVMGDDRREVEATLQHRDHLVPGLEHFAAVDALDLEALEDHLV